MEKKLKKILVVLIVGVILIIGSLLIFVVLQDDKSKFIGTWKEIGGTTPSGPYKNYSYLNTYYDNNSMKQSVVNISSGETLAEYWNIYKIEFGKLYFGPDESRFGTPLSYSFSPDGTELILRINSRESWFYLKIS